MSQITLTSPLHALIPTLRSRRARALEGAHGSTSSTRQPVGLPTRTRATASFDRDLTGAQSQLFLALR